MHKEQLRELGRINGWSLGFCRAFDAVATGFAVGVLLLALLGIAYLLHLDPRIP